MANTAAIAQRLAQSTVITAITGDRILEEDYRVSGWNTSPVTVLDQDGIVLTTLVVDDRGAMSPLNGPIEAEEGSVYIWGFSSRSIAGKNEVTTLMRVAKTMLNGWQDPQSRAILTWSGRVGSVLADDGAFDRCTFRVHGISTTEE